MYFMQINQIQSDKNPRLGNFQKIIQACSMCVLDEMRAGPIHKIDSNFSSVHQIFPCEA